MIIKKEEQAEVLSNFDSESINMSIDDSDKQVLMHILSTGLYQDPIGSLIRENVSNNLDATVEAGSKEPVIVGLKRDEAYNWFFYSQDFGTGISPERLEKIISKYAASTKRGDGAQKGYFGLGLKSSLAYTDSFWIITSYNGTKYSYLMYKGEDGSKIDLIDSQPTTEGNGTMFKVYIKNNSNTDIVEFKTKIKEQLSYIDNLYFDVDGMDNEYQIYKSEHWWFTPQHMGKPMHMVLDGIYYPLDFLKLDIPSINIPIALKFEITDGLVPVPSRESVILNPATKTKILNKLALVAKDIVERVNKENVAIIGWFEFLKAYTNSHKRLIIDEKYELRVDSISRFTDVEFVHPIWKDFDLKYNKPEVLATAFNHIFEQSKCVLRISNSRATSKNLYETLSNSIDRSIKWRSNYCWITRGNNISVIKADYLKDFYDNTSCIFNYKPTRKLGKRQRFYSADDTYVNMLSLNAFPKSEWRERIKECQRFEQYILDNYTYDLDRLVIPEKWVNERKERKRAGRISFKRDKETFLLRRIYPSNRSNWGGTFSSFDSNRDELKSRKGLHVYSSLDNKAELAKLAEMFYKSKSRVIIIAVAACHLKKLENLKNFITYEEFMKGETKPFSIYATALLIKNRMEALKIHYTLKEKIEKVDPKFYKLLEKIEKYEEMIPGHWGRGIEDFFESIIEHAEQNKQLDYNMMVVLKQFEEKVREYEFMNMIDFHTVNEKEAISLSREIIKYRRLANIVKNRELEAEIITTPEEVFEAQSEAVTDEEIEEIN